MHQRQAAKDAWTGAGLYRSKNARVREFLKYVDATPGDCWPVLTSRLRTTYPDLLEVIVEPLWKSGDKLLRANLIRHADPSRREERALLEKLSRGLDPVIDLPEIAEVVRSGMGTAIERLAQDAGVPERLRTLAARRLVVLARETADAAAEKAELAAAEARAEVPAAPVRAPTRQRKARGRARGKAAGR